MNDCKKTLEIIRDKFLEHLLRVRENHRIDAPEMKLLNDFFNFLTEEIEKENN